jgi:hypothetical protein
LRYETYGFLAYTTEVRVVRDTVVLRRVGSGAADPVFADARRVPSAAEWREFWAAVRAAGVRSWPARCEQADVVDGGGFRFELAWADARRAGTYTNSAPLPGGRCSAGSYEAAGRFQRAVLLIAGLAPPAISH